MTAEAIVAPTDAQLALIEKLCRERDYDVPQAVYSTRDASNCITEMLGGTYNSNRYAANTDLPECLRP